MRVFLSSPTTAGEAHLCNGLDVLLSFPHFKNRPSIVRDYAPTFRSVLIDSGAWSMRNSGAVVDLDEYAEFCSRVPYAIACAGLDDIDGDWRQSLKNYAEFPLGFPTIHDSDPPELLNELIPMARERGGWIGIGLVPPRTGKEKRDFVRWALREIPSDLHVHGWACGIHTALPGRPFDSFDSTTWLLDAQAMNVRRFPWLTPMECMEISIKRIQRVERLRTESGVLPLFE